MIVLESLFYLALAPQQVPEVVVCPLIKGIDPNSLMIVLESLFQLALADEQKPQAVVGHPRFLINGKGVPPQFFCVVPDLCLFPGQSTQPNYDQSYQPASKDGQPSEAVSYPDSPAVK
jgi:hypothetical protein